MIVFSGLRRVAFVVLVRRPVERAWLLVDTVLLRVVRTILLVVLARRLVVRSEWSLA